MIVISVLFSTSWSFGYCEVHEGQSLDVNRPDTIYGTHLKKQRKRRMDYIDRWVKLQSRCTELSLTVRSCGEGQAFESAVKWPSGATA